MKSEWQGGPRGACVLLTLPAASSPELHLPLTLLPAYPRGPSDLRVGSGSGGPGPLTLLTPPPSPHPPLTLS